VGHSKNLPSAFAPWSEAQALTRVLRRERRILQGIPNISTKVNALLFLMESTGIGREPLKTNVVSMVDVRSNRGVARMLGKMSRFVNQMLGADFRWQALPVPFDIFADGVDVPLFEELGAGSAALDFETDAERRALFADPAFRRSFRRQWTSLLAPRIYHRDFVHSRIEGAPDASLVGRSIAEVAWARGQDVVETFMDLVAEHGEKLRWSTVVGNDRPKALRGILTHPDILVGFSDAGAHLRNMAFYNMQLRMIRMARDAERDRAPFMSVERAVHRCTGELAEWFGLDAGVLATGKRADLVVVDPEKLDDSLDGLVEAPIAEFGGYPRLVRRNDAAVPLVVVGGRVAFRHGVASRELGKIPFGGFLGHGETHRPARARTRPRAAPRECTLAS
jgi:N-acyl-D-aspartate/D-glutamate deacylase